MSELKARHIVDVYDSYYAENPFGKHSQVYLKSEADKVIAGRDKEIAKLKDSIGKLLKSKTEQVMDEVFERCLIYGEGFVPVEHAMRLVAELRHHKFKRCLDNAAKYLWKRNYWRDSMPAYERQHQWENMAYKHYKRWLELAEKFKDNEAK